VGTNIASVLRPADRRKLEAARRRSRPASAGSRRTAHGASTREIADVLGLSHVAVANWVRASRSPNHRAPSLVHMALTRGCAPAAPPTVAGRHAQCASLRPAQATIRRFRALMARP
jgi:DNA-binding transcriptional regulator YiaG